MNTKLPIQAKSTDRLLKSVFPAHFKLVSDKNSNGYKLVNLLFGVEIDQLEKSIREVYDDCFLPTIDLTNDFSIYELYISGIPITSYLNENGSIPIKITDSTEFYYGEPTRILPAGTIPLPMYYLTYSGTAIPSGAGFQNGFDKGFNIPCWSTVSGIVGLEYIRKDLRGSGYLIISSDIDQEIAFHSGLYPTFVIDVGNNLKNSGDFVNTYGMYLGIKDINLSGILTNEILNPINSNTLSKQYPLTRTIVDSSGGTWTIDHYTPYLGYSVNHNGDVVAKVDYTGLFYYTDSGEKIYYRTAFNNPYGYNNYNKAYIDLNFIPISGTLKIFDIDCLDYSGNATEIYPEGRSLYYTSGYLGYDDVVPSGMGFPEEGFIANYLKTTTWGYMHEGCYFDDSTLTWIDGTGNITNKIWILDYNSRYMVEYKTVSYQSTKYFTSLNSTTSVSLDSKSPVLTTDRNLYLNIDYEFTKDASYGSFNSKIITLDGLKHRPNSMIDKVSFNIPFMLSEGSLNNPISINTSKLYAGYSNEFVPQITNFVYSNDLNWDSDFKKFVFLNFNFNSRTNIEYDTIYYNAIKYPNYILTYSGVNNKYLINSNVDFGKKIIDVGSGSYFYNSGLVYILPNLNYLIDCSLTKSQSGILMDITDDISDKYINFYYTSDGKLNINSNGYLFKSDYSFNFNSLNKKFILKYTLDPANDDIPYFDLYFKEEGMSWYQPINLKVYTVDSISFSGTIFKVFKDCYGEIYNLQVFYEE